MSADNWGECPKCRVIQAAGLAGLKQRLETDYGKIPLADYKALEQKVADYRISSSEKYTMREDYEFWLNEDGVFLADYRASCNVCDFEFTFRYEQEVEL